MSLRWTGGNAHAPSMSRNHAARSLSYTTRNRALRPATHPPQHRGAPITFLLSPAHPLLGRLCHIPLFPAVRVHFERVRMATSLSAITQQQFSITPPLRVDVARVLRWCVRPTYPHTRCALRGYVYVRAYDPTSNPVCACGGCMYRSDCGVCVCVCVCVRGNTVEGSVTA